MATTRVSTRPDPDPNPNPKPKPKPNPNPPTTPPPFPIAQTGMQANQTMIAEALSAAQGADVVVLSLGLGNDIEVKG